MRRVDARSGHIVHPETRAQLVKDVPRPIQALPVPAENEQIRSDKPQEPGAGSIRTMRIGYRSSTQPDDQKGGIKI